MSAAELASTAFLYMAVATASGALAFLAAQRASGRTAPEVERAYESALLLDSVAKDLRSLADSASKDDAPVAEGRDELVGARAQLDEAITGLRRGADLVV